MAKISRFAPAARACLLRSPRFASATRSCSSRASSARITSTASSRTFLGFAGGATVGAAAGSLLLWPVADLVFAPYLIAEAMVRPMSEPAHGKPAAEVDVSRLKGLLSTPSARLCVLAGATQEQRAALAREAGRDRPVIRLSLRQATSPHTMQLSLIEQLYQPVGAASLMSCLAVWWLSLFDMLISDHQHTRHRDFCVVLAQARRAMQMRAPRLASDPRPLLIVEHMYVPTGASSETGGEGLAPMLRSLRQYLCAVSIDEGVADVLVLAPQGSEAGRSAAATWRGQARKSCAERATLSGGAVAIALTQSEALDAWLAGMRLQ